MRQYLLDLYEIQKLDLHIRDQEKQHETLPLRLTQLEKSLEGLRSQLSALNAQRDQVVQEAQTLRHQVGEEAGKIRKWEARLNDIRNQREYQALSRETEGSKRANRDSETKIGELNATREQLEGQIETLESKVEAEVTIHDTEAERVRGLQAEMDGSLRAERERRDELIPRVPKPLYRRYDQVRARRMGMGLSPVAAGSCTGCNIRLPPQLYNILQRCDSIEECPSCKRIIFWDQILATPEAPSVGGMAPVAP